MHASTSQLAGSCSTLQQHKDPRTHHTLTQQRLAQHRAVSVASGARRLFVALRCFFVVLWLLFLLRCLHKLVPWANLSSMPTHTKCVAVHTFFNSCIVSMRAIAELLVYSGPNQSGGPRHARSTRVWEIFTPSPLGTQE